MNRSSWLREKQRLSEYRYDTIHASSYDQNWAISMPLIGHFYNVFLHSAHLPVLFWMRHVALESIGL